MAEVIGGVRLKKKGATGGIEPGSESSANKRNAPLAIKGGGSTHDPIPRKTRVVGQGEH